MNYQKYLIKLAFLKQHPSGRINYSNKPSSEPVSDDEPAIHVLFTESTTACSEKVSIGFTDLRA